MASEDGRSLPELLGGLAGDISSLFRKEIQLAKAEASEKAGELMGGVQSSVIGVVLLLGAIGVLLSAAVSLLAALFVAMNMDPTLSNALAAIIVAVVVGGIGWSFVSRGMASFKTQNLNLNRTADSLGRDAEIVKERM